MARKRETAGMTQEQRFAHYTQKRDGCWLWGGYRNNNGYGMIALGGGKEMLAHRWAYQSYVAPLDGRHVCHTCDNPACVNPAHLFLGTDADNHTDKAMKLRAGKVLRPEQVREIKELVTKSRTPLHAIAEMFGCSRKSIQRIKNGQYWRFA